MSKSNFPVKDADVTQFLFLNSQVKLNYERLRRCRKSPFYWLKIKFGKL